ncbi:MAG: putative RNA methyltransferase [Ktedonobacterales bacterium]
MLICPICDAPLTRDDRVLRCTNGHSFDIARESYVNLLRDRVTGQTGDTKEMLRARRRFLDRGYYAPLARAVSRMTLAHLADHPTWDTTTVLDAGCGEGYYIGALERELDATSRPHHCYGADVAKDAVRIAAKRYPGVFFIVADIWKKLPFAGGSLHALLDIFAPRNAAEFARILTTGGLLLIVIPGPHHLEELRTSLNLLGIEQQKEEHIVEQLAGAFSLRQRESLDYQLTLNPEDVADLVTMTPTYRHRAPAIPTNTSDAAVRTTASFILLAFERDG